MGLLERKWLIDNIAFVLQEMEYYREHKVRINGPKFLLWELNSSIGELKLNETTR